MPIYGKRSPPSKKASRHRVRPTRRHDTLLAVLQIREAIETARPFAAE